MSPTAAPFPLMARYIPAGDNPAAPGAPRPARSRPRNPVSDSCLPPPLLRTARSACSRNRSVALGVPDLMGAPSVTPRRSHPFVAPYVPRFGEIDPTQLSLE